MKGRRPSGFRVTTGIILFFAVIAILSSNRETLFMKGISMIDTEINEAGSSAAFVRTKMDFGSNEHMLSFPWQVGEWEATGEYDWAMIKELLGADVMLVRSYDRPELYMPVFLLIAQSGDVSSFHPPPVCYRAQGYEIDEESTVKFPVTDSVWAGDSWRSMREGNIFKGELSAKLLIVSKRNTEGEITERRGVLYYYVKDSSAVTDSITMIEVSATAPVNLPYDGTIELLKTLLGDSIPAMFEPHEKSERIAMDLIHSHGALGWVYVISSLSIPAAIMLAPLPNIKIRRTKKKHISAS